MTNHCSNPECGASTGIHGGLTFGSGKLYVYGYWEFPCRPCAEHTESTHPEYGPCWPFSDEFINSKEIHSELWDG